MGGVCLPPPSLGGRRRRLSFSTSDNKMRRRRLGMTSRKRVVEGVGEGVVEGVWGWWRRVVH